MLIITKENLTFKRIKRSKGSSIVETAVGALVLMPVFLVLIDLIALVIGQTINDDIAKNAARYAAQGSNNNAGDPNSATTLANNYMLTCPYISPSGLVRDAQIISINWNTTQVEVITQVTINLPIEVPVIRITQQTMQSQATEPSIGVSAVPPGG